MRELAATADRLRTLAARLGAELDARLVVLFGSAARADRREPEDLDIGVLRDGGIDVVAVTNELIRLLGVQGVDVADLARAEPLLLMLVAREGVPLYEREPGEYARFCSLATRRYADTRKFRLAEREAIRDFVARRSAGR